jgi:hypothetical protein
MKTVEKIEVSLSGPEGNAFSLLALAKKLSSDSFYNYEAIVDLMKSGDYDNLIKVFKLYFGDRVICID